MVGFCLDGSDLLVEEVMSVQGEEVTGRIESTVRESVDRLIEELRSSIQDVREVVDSQLDAALQSMQADVKALSLGSAIAPIVEEMQASLSAAAPSKDATPFPDTSAPVQAPDSSALRRAIRAVERGRSQVDVLNSLLDQACGFGSRAALLILKGDTFSGWKGAGFSANQSNDELIKRLAAGPGAIPEFDQVRTTERSVSWDGGSFAAVAGVPAPQSAIIVPMVIKDKVAAAMYVDVDSSTPIDQAGVELLVFTTGLLIDTLAIRKKIPSPTLSPDDGSDQAGASADVFSEVSTASPPPPPAAPAPPAPAMPEPPSDMGDATVAVTPEMIQQAQAAQAPPAASAPPPVPAAPAAPASTQYVPPAGAATPAQSMSDEARKHDDAKRFARLLVSEIKLYNEAKVDQGRKNHDLYERLKEDIDRSRQMYDERVPEQVRKVSNYFYDELVRILADGNSESLGL